MYVYEFFESNRSITLSLEDMNGSGPKCSSCGAVLLPNTSKMLVLSYDHDKVDNWGVNITNIPPVLPYVYDFETKQWSIETETPRLNANNQSTDIFGVRFGHNTVVGSNGMVYIIGGRSIWSGSGSARLACLTSTWYYNPEDHSYNALPVEAPWCFHYANAFSTPISDSYILLNFGAKDNHMRPDDYNVTNKYEYLISDTTTAYAIPSFATILDTATNLWYAVNITGPTPYARYGATTQYNPKTNLTHTFGGYFYGDGRQFVLQELITMDAGQGQWYEKDSLIPNTEDISARFLASSAIVLDKYFVVMHGMTIQSSQFIDVSDVDVYLLPDRPEGDTNLTEYMMDVLIDNLDPLQQSPSTGLAPKYIAAITVVCVVLFVVLPLVYIILKRKRAINKCRRIITAVLWDQRKGELFWIEGFRLLVKIASLLVIIAFIIFSYRQIKDSPISSTSETKPVTQLPFPDIRFCFGGWNDAHGQLNASASPTITCQVPGARNGSEGRCNSMIHSLNSAIHSPYFVGQENQLQCYMFKYDESFNSTVSSSSISFRIMGTINYNNEAVYIHVYDAKKNPNRYVFFDEPLPADTTKKDIDVWARADNDISQIKNYFSMYAESSTSIKYKITKYNKLDPYGAWNYIGGVFPKYLTSQELDIQYTAPTMKNRFVGYNVSLEHKLSEIQVSPLSFEEETVTDKRDSTVLGALGAIGGIFGLLSLLQIILFGSRPVSPWGFAHMITLRKQNKALSSTLDDGLLNNTHTEYDRSEVTFVPVAEPVDNRFYAALRNIDATGSYGNEECNLKTTQLPLLKESTEERLSRLETRNQMMELVLKSYYIDDKIFQSLKDVRHDTAAKQQGRGKSHSEIDIENNTEKGFAKADDSKVVA
ncbi:unnamed protein product [Mucor fragilis]